MDMTRKMQQMMHHHHGPKCCRLLHKPAWTMMPPLVMLVPATFIAGYVVGTLLLAKMVKLLELVALSETLDAMEGRLSEIEKADLEGRIRARAFGQ